MKSENNLLVHYWELPEGFFISLKSNFHERLCGEVQNRLKNNKKNCFHKLLNCSKWHAQRLFTQFTRLTIIELEKLREFVDITKEEVEQNIETLGCHENRTIIKNPKLPFQIKDLVYVASHLIFDGSYRDKRGCYFYAYEPSLVEYHKKRLSELGEVPINFIEKENQLYFSYTVGFIAKKVLEIETFKSTQTYLSKKMKNLAKENKFLADEIIKASIIDEGRVDDKIEIELANQRLVNDIYDIANQFYKLTKVTSRTRDIDFKTKSEWTYNSTVWKINFSADSFKDMLNSLSPLPIVYKQENLGFLSKRQSRDYNQRKMYETKKLIVRSLMKNPKTIEDLAKELLVKQTTIRAHFKGHPTYSDDLLSLGIIEKVDEKLLRRGGYAKADVYGIKDTNKATEFLNN